MTNKSSGASLMAPRRTILPQTYIVKEQAKKDLKPQFSPYARVLTIDSHKDLDEEHKFEIWWQKSDYDEFRKTARIITRAMLQGGSEIWLQLSKTTPSGKPSFPRRLPDSLVERQESFRKGDLNAKKEHEDTRNKWWHRFGHTRRGLEHIASIDEGRQRQANVRASTRAVMEEQSRQQMFKKPDPAKMKSVYIQANSWARDLALASGESDADAVEKKFDEVHRKSREYYLQRRLSRSETTESAMENTSKTVPNFMKPELRAVPKSLLDANTSSQIRFRHVVAQQKKRAASSPSSNPLPIKTSESVDSDFQEVASPHTLARKAAGFCANGDEVANMSAVLTGMGPIPKKVVLGTSPIDTS